MIRFVEVGPRDGLQNERELLPLDEKVRLVEALAATGVAEVEAGAFVSPKAVPQMADSAEVFRRIRRRPGVVYSALVPNEKGLEAAQAARVDKIAVFTAASESFNRRNINASIAESIERFGPVVDAWKGPTRAYVSTAFYCPYEGKISPEKVVEVVARLKDLHAFDDLSIGDTIGRAAPRDVAALLEALLKIWPVERLFLHFHDTYGMAVANALAAWREFGVTGFDASAGGLGGCPYAPGAGGNVATEDLAFAFEASGASTGVDVAKVKSAAAALAPRLGHPLASRLSKVELSR